MRPPGDDVQMEINGLILDPHKKTPVVILRDPAGQQILPIWIGPFEANAIALRLEQVNSPRPMTHDLLHTLVEHLDAVVQRVLISDLKDNTFFARIFLQRGVEELDVDARPSDALALALRAEVPIYVAQTVLEKVNVSEPTTEAEEQERLRKWLEEVDPDDLGKYTM